jgi:hypothetical protein
MSCGPKAIQVRLALEAGGIGTWEWELATGQMKWSAQMFRNLGLEARDQDDCRRAEKDRLRRLEKRRGERYSNRFAGATAGAAYLAATRLRGRLARIAAAQLNLHPENLCFAGGVYSPPRTRKIR